MQSPLQDLINSQTSDLRSKQLEFNDTYQLFQPQEEKSRSIGNSESIKSAPNTTSPDLNFVINVGIEGIEEYSLSFSVGTFVDFDEVEDVISELKDDPLFNLANLQILDLDDDNALDVFVATQGLQSPDINGNGERIFTSDVETIEIPFDEFIEEESFSDSGRSSRIIEAEDLNLENYVVEDFSEINTDDGTEISDSLGISLIDVPEGTGTASLLAEDYNLSGIYDLTIGYYDENDGEATIEVLINDDVVLRTIVLDESTLSGYPVDDNFQLYTIEGLNILPSDIITIQGTSDEYEWARVDNLSFTTDIS